MQSSEDSSRNKRSKLKRLIPFLILAVGFSVGAGYLVTLYFNYNSDSVDILLVHYVAASTFVLLVLWWFLLTWRLRHLSLLDLQEFFIKNKMVAFNFIRVSALAPWSLSSHKGRLLRAVAAEYRALMEKVKDSNQTLEKYVGTNVSSRASQRAMNSELGGELRRVYVLFSDVRGFTRMTEQLKANETVDILNKMFTAMEEVITLNGGDINKYIGDAIMAYFRRPYGNEGDAAKAVLHTALRMQDKFELLNNSFKAAYSYPIEIGLGIGVTAGEAIVGNLGSANRMEFTLIGDTVNLSSRLCGIAKHGQVLVNEEMARITEKDFELTALPPVQIKGKSGMHTPYAVVRQRLTLSR
jgi:class 3 adenylate cyclase